LEEGVVGQQDHKKAEHHTSEHEEARVAQEGLFCDVEAFVDSSEANLEVFVGQLREFAVQQDEDSEGKEVDNDGHRDRSDSSDPVTRVRSHVEVGQVDSRAQM